jgi:hypothetical protein
VLTRVVAVLDEQFLIGIERKTPGQEPRARNRPSAAVHERLT